MSVPLIIPPPIETERLRVRLVVESDLPAVLLVNGDEQVTRFLPYLTWTGMDDANGWLGRVAKLHEAGNALQFVVADKSTDLAIGTALIFQYDEKSARAEIGYVLGRAHWGKGYMREALSALVAAAFGPMGLRRLEAEVDPQNLPSQNVVRALGFTREGLLRERYLAKGAPRDIEMYGLLAHEWAATKGRA